MSHRSRSVVGLSGSSFCFFLLFVARKSKKGLIRPSVSWTLGAADMRADMDMVYTKARGAIVQIIHNTQIRQESCS
jgi:hypothetical protein